MMEMQIGEFEKWRMPSGAVVYYRDKDHSYWQFVDKSGEAGEGSVSSPSTISGYLSPDKEGLMIWAEKMALQGMGVIVSRSIQDASTPDEIPDVLAWAEDPQIASGMLAEEGLGFRKVRNAAGSTGTFVHDVFERLLRGERIDRTRIPEDAVKLVGAVEKFLADNPVEPIHLEQVVFSQTYNYAGRFDAMVRHTETGKVWLLDLKTSKSIGVGAHAQLQGYDIAAEESQLGAADELYILHVRRSGTYKLIPCCATRDHFLAALRAQEAEREIKAEMKLVPRG